MMHNQTLIKPRPFVLQLVDAAAGEKVLFFKAVKEDRIEIKIYFTKTKLILAKFQNRNLIELQHRLRPPRESLLGVEGALIEQLRIEKLAS